ncbi:hypothetical protein MKW98_028111 [Papaver atlanticum]|uniref:Phosphorylated adapter RNA export protein n=1 Tax=Papaver atlanticum TaxID=357466 RepID=A0AAD4XMH2_9MAGN|nr:hypothetical protein MKW98_028111 [Papaver atlanticum]
MEGSENLLKAIYEDDSLEDYQDADMLDSETLGEGECRIQIGSLQLTETSKSEEEECTGKIGDLGLTEMGSRGDVSVNQAPNTNKKKKNKNKKKNKSKKTGPAPAINNMNKLVIDTCKRLKERKTYLVWNAVGVLGVSALSDIVNEVDAIQACGGQMTADGKRHRYGGGILWGILKKRDPNAYKEIMAKGKEIERQFKQQAPKELNPSLQKTAQSSIAGPMINHTSASSALAPPLNCRAAASNIKRERISVVNRIRVPVTYDDLLVEEVGP